MLIPINAAPPRSIRCRSKCEERSLLVYLDLMLESTMHKSRVTFCGIHALHESSRTMYILNEKTWSVGDSAPPSERRRPCCCHVSAPIARIDNDSFICSEAKFTSESVKVMNTIHTWLATLSIEKKKSKHRTWSFSGAKPLHRCYRSISVVGWTCHFFTISGLSPVLLLNRQGQTLTFSSSSSSSSLMHLSYRSSSAVQLFLHALSHLAENMCSGLLCELLWCDFGTENTTFWQLADELQPFFFKEYFKWAVESQVSRASQQHMNAPRTHCRGLCCLVLISFYFDFEFLLLRGVFRRLPSVLSSLSAFLFVPASI